MALAGVVGVVLGVGGWLVWGRFAAAGLSPLGGVPIGVGIVGLAGAKVIVIPFHRAGAGS